MRSINLLLFISLISAAAFLPSILNALNMNEPRVPRQIIHQTAITQAYGKLYVVVLLGSVPAFLLGTRIVYSEPVDVVAIFKPLPHESVAISSQDFPGSPIVLSTNASGSLEVILPVSDHYTLTINESRFHQEIHVRVAEGKTTRVILQANRIAYEVFFQELSDGYSSGWGTSVESIFLMVHSSTKIENIGDAVFLQTLTESFSSCPSASSGCLKIQETRAIVLGEDQSQDTVWVQVRPLRSVTRSGVLGTVILTYRPTYTIIIPDG